MVALVELVLRKYLKSRVVSVINPLVVTLFGMSTLVLAFISVPTEPTQAVSPVGLSGTNS
ncbi:MAG: hypothetical protein R3F37_04015 [Candidatus Competibacteraceae bacterium]